MLINPHQDSNFPDSAALTSKGEMYSAGPRYLHPEREPHLGVCDPEGSEMVHRPGTFSVGTTFVETVRVLHSRLADFLKAYQMEQKGDQQDIQ
jgi:hypothetical protein